MLSFVFLCTFHCCMCTLISFVRLIVVLSVVVVVIVGANVVLVAPPNPLNLKEMKGL